MPRNIFFVSDILFLVMGMNPRRVVANRSQVRTRSSSRIDSFIGLTTSGPSDPEKRYNERMAAFNRLVRSPEYCSTPKSSSVSRFSAPVVRSPTRPRQQRSFSNTEWKRVREQNVRRRTSDIEKILINLNRVKNLLQSPS